MNVSQREANKAARGLSAQQVEEAKAQLAIIKEVRRWLDVRLGNEPECDENDPQSLIEATAFDVINLGVMAALGERVDKLGEFMGIERDSTTSSEETMMLIIDAFDSGNHRLG